MELSNNKGNNNIRTLFEISDSIIMCYDNLNKLEKAGLTESQFFKVWIKRLKYYLNIENSFYERLGNDSDYLMHCLTSITMIELAWDLDLDFLFLREDKKSDLITRRITLRLVDRIINCGDVTSLNYNIVNTEKISEASVKKFTILNIAIKKDFVNTVLTLINMQIEEETNNYIRAKLLDMKYNISFMYQFIEEDLIEHNFAVNPNLYWISPAIADSELIIRQLVNTYQSIQAGKMKRPVRELMEISRKDLDKDDVYFNAIVSQILIRTCLLFGKGLTRREIEKILFTNFKNYNGSAMFMIKDALDMNESDREIPQLVSLKLY